MESEIANSLPVDSVFETSSVTDRHPAAVTAAPPSGAPTATSGHDNTARRGQSVMSTSGLSTWAKSLKIPQPSSLEASGSGSPGKSAFSRFTSGIGLRLSPKAPATEEKADSPTSSTSAQTGVFGTITKGLVDSSKNAVKAVQVKARHIVSQNKRRYQEDGFDLDMTYITENIIAMGFPAGDMSSGFFGYVEGFYRNHMEEVIKFFETHHQGKYKVYNLCSERLYDASLFEGKVACFPFDDHNCPPTQLIISFCQSAYSWLKTDIENVVVVHCKAGMARTGLMISSLLLYLKFFPTAEESIDYYNKKRCFDGKGLVLPSQIRYVKYFERILTYFNGENQPGRRCMLRGFRLHRCPYWIRPSITVSNHDGVLFSTKKHPRTKDLAPEDIWFTAPRKGIMVFALPGEPGLTELCGDFKVHFHDRQGDFYCWLNTTMMENRKVLTTSDLDGFDKRKLPSPGFQLEVVVADYDGSIPTKSKSEEGAPEDDKIVSNSSSTAEGAATPADQIKSSGSNDKDDVFADNKVDEASKNPRARTVSETRAPSSESGKPEDEEVAGAAHGVQQLSLTGQVMGSALVPEGTNKLDDANKQVIAPVSGAEEPKLDPGTVSEFKAIAADASVFTFGDEDDYESE